MRFASTADTTAKCRGSWSPNLFIDLVNQYEAAAEPLARIFGVLGRWGTDRKFAEAIEIISMVTQQDSYDGVVVLLAMRTYPALLLVYAFGLGTLKAGRYDRMFALFSTRMENPYRDTKRFLIESLFHNAWEGSDRGNWNLLPEHNSKNYKSPLSRHLRLIFSAWAADYIFLPNEVDLLFAEFELLGAFAFMSLKYDRIGVQQSLTGAQPMGQNYLWCPVGEFAWDSKTLNSIMSKWEAEPAKKQLLAAGFGHGDSESFDSMRVSLERLIGAMAWQ